MVENEDDMWIHEIEEFLDGKREKFPAPGPSKRGTWPPSYPNPLTPQKTYTTTSTWTSNGSRDMSLLRPLLYKACKDFVYWYEHENKKARPDFDILMECFKVLKKEVNHVDRNIKD